MLRTRVVWTGVAGTPYYSNLFWNGNTSGIAQLAQAKTIAWVEALADSLSAPLSAQVQPEVAEISLSSGQIINLYDAPAQTVAMVGPDQPLPRQVQLLTYFGTTGIVDGRRVKGRNFLPGAQETYNLNGVGPIEAARVSIQNVYSETLEGSDAQLVVWSRKGQAAFPVTSFQTSNVWSTLRTRRAADG